MNRMAEITIGSGVTSIGANAFEYCMGLESFSVSENNEYFSSDANGVLFDKNKTQLIKYPAIAEMPIISSNYWNMVHGASASDVPEDKEGIQTMRVLGKNMAYFLKCIEAGKKAGINAPEREKKEITNFIR